MKKVFGLALAVISIGIALTSFKPLANSVEVKYIVEDCERLVEDASKLFDKYYNPDTYYSYEMELNEKRLLKAETLTIENDSKEYWTISIEQMYVDLSTEEKQVILDIKNETPNFELAYSLLKGEEPNNNDVDKELNSLVKRASKINTTIKRLIGAGSAAAAFSVISSMVAGINTASWIPFVGWAVAAVLVASLIIYVVANWSYIRDGFNSFISSLKRTYSRIAGLLTSASKEAEDKAKDNPDVAENATSPNQMEQEVKRGQAPKDVKRVDYAHDSKGQPHVHFKDGTSLNRDGTIHDKGHGRPNPSSKVWDWLHKHGWCQNGIK